MKAFFSLTSQLTILVCSEILRYSIHTKFSIHQQLLRVMNGMKKINNKQQTKKLRQKLRWIHGWYTDHRPF